LKASVSDEFLLSDDETILTFSSPQIKTPFPGGTFSFFVAWSAAEEMRHASTKAEKVTTRGRT
jgi:hypothetical protein